MNAKGLLYHHGDCRTDETVRVDPEGATDPAQLLTNAAKFTEPGGEIALSCDVDGHSVRIAVHDNGAASPKISSRACSILRAGGPTSHAGRASRAWLGLAISRELAIGMGGSWRRRVGGARQYFLLRSQEAASRNDKLGSSAEDAVAASCQAISVSLIRNSERHRDTWAGS